MGERVHYPVVWSCNEWDPLEEVIVGTAKHARLPLFDGGMNRLEPETKDSMPSTEDRRYPRWVIEQTEEDIELFVEQLTKLGVVVRRPDPINFDGLLRTPYWSSDFYFQYPPRDIFLLLGDLFIESPCPFRSRQFETWAYRRLMVEYMRRGARWLAAPRPTLKDELYEVDADGAPTLAEAEPVFDAANVLRAGRDLIYLRSCSGNKLGAQWLQSTVGADYRVHVCEDLYKGTHIDTTLSLLRPGLVLVNPERVRPENLPAPLKRWDIIQCPEPRVTSRSSFTPISSKWLGMNLLMIRPDLAVVDADQLELIRLLERQRIECIPLRLRHGAILAGGFHCITIDVRRRGGLEDYSS